MKHKVFFDEELWAIVFTAHGEFKIEDTNVTTRMMQEIIDARGDCALLVDLRDSPPKVDKEVRRSLQGPHMGEGMTKMAMITTHPAVRMMGKIVTGIMGRGEDTKFFKTEAQARAWLKVVAPVRSKDAG